MNAADSPANNDFITFRDEVVVGKLNGCQSVMQSLDGLLDPVRAYEGIVNGIR